MSTQEERKRRNWVYDPAVDDAESECGLDGRSWEVVIQNSGAAAVSSTSKREAGDYRTTPDQEGGVDMQVTALAKEAIRRMSH